ncbi:MAG: hypothetical protein ACO3F2_07590, partial [Roseiflexaceae bacterium]
MRSDRDGAPQALWYAESQWHTYGHGSLTRTPYQTRQATPLPQSPQPVIAWPAHDAIVNLVAILAGRAIFSLCTMNTVEEDCTPVALQPIPA